MIRVNEDLRTIELTRGDSTVDNELSKLAFRLPYFNGTEVKDYVFKLDDKISFVVMPKKGYTKEEIMRIDYTLEDLGYTEPTTVVEIPLSSLDTKKFPLSNKRATYWYDIVLNDSLTVLGYDDEGASKIIVYPEVGEDLTQCQILKTLDFSFVQGDTFSKNITINNCPKDITDIYFTVKEPYNNKIIVLQKTINKGGIVLLEETENGAKYNLLINATDTDKMKSDKEYVYDMEIVAGTIKTTILKGTITLEADVTKTVDE